MKKILLLLSFALSGWIMYGQTAYSVFNSVSSKDIQLQEVSANNVWIGAKLTGQLGANDDFSDAIVVNGRVLYNADFKSFKLPIISNVSLNFSDIGDIEGFLVGDKGISIGLYPYRVVKSGSDFNIVLHGGLAYKLIPKDKLSITPKQTKIFAGFEVAKKVKEDSYPLTFSVSPAYLINNLERSNFMAIEATGIVPVSGGLGLLVEYTAPFDAKYKNIFKVGVILNSVLR
mgnify:FL=1